MEKKALNSFEKLADCLDLAIGFSAKKNNIPTSITDLRNKIEEDVLKSGRNREDVLLSIARFHSSELYGLSNKLSKGTTDQMKKKVQTIIVFVREVNETLKRAHSISDIGFKIDMNKVNEVNRLLFEMAVIIDDDDDDFYTTLKKKGNRRRSKNKESSFMLSSKRTKSTTFVNPSKKIAASESHSTVPFAQTDHTPHKIESRKKGQQNEATDGKAQTNRQHKEQGSVLNAVSTCTLTVQTPTEKSVAISETGRSSNNQSRKETCTSNLLDIQVGNINDNAGNEIPAEDKIVPKFVHPIQSKTATEGDGIVFWCETNLQSAPTDVKWFCNGNELKLDGRHEIKVTKNGTIFMIINSVQKEDGGTICVEIENPAGKAKCEAELNVSDLKRVKKEELKCEAESNMLNLKEVKKKEHTVKVKEHQRRKRGAKGREVNGSKGKVTLLDDYFTGMPVISSTSTNPMQLQSNKRDVKRTHSNQHVLDAQGSKQYLHEINDQNEETRNAKQQHYDEQEIIEIE